MSKEAFEKWAKKEEPTMDLSTFINGAYIYAAANTSFRAWQAAQAQCVDGKEFVPAEPSREAALKETLQELYDYCGAPLSSEQFKEWRAAMDKARELLKC